MPIRVAIEAWQIILPHRELIRFAAMLALMAAGGMSAALMMGDRFLPAGETANPVATTAQQSNGADAATQHAELQPTLEPVLAPDSDTSSVEPTATGPLAPATPPLMAVESQEPSAALPYPVTAYAEPILPPLEDGSLPQVKTTEPEVARLRGDLIKTKVR